MPAKLLLEEGRWYGLQTIGAYSAEAAPFGSTPVLLEGVKPLKSGKGLLKIGFVRAFAPIRAVRERPVLKVVHHEAGVLIGQLQGPAGSKKLLAITDINSNWFRQHNPRLWKRLRFTLGDADLDDSDLQDFMGSVLGRSSEEVLAGAQSHSFHVRLSPLPPERGMMRFEREYDAEDSWFLLRGLVPQDSDLKWLIFAKMAGGGGSLYFHRRGTGVLIYEVPFDLTNDGIRIRWAYVNLSPEIGAGTRQQEASQLDWFITELLLARQWAGSWPSSDEAPLSPKESWYGPAQAVNSSKDVTDAETAEASKPSLNSFQLNEPEQRFGFLFRLTELGDEALLPAVSHVWGSLSRPRAARASAMGIASGAGGTGKKAVWNMLSRMLMEVSNIETPPLPSSNRSSTANRLSD